jgi:hypothetical protein
VICVTPENVLAPWLNFEAGAISKKAKGEESRVIPFAFGFASAADVPPPLGQFQSRLADEEGARKLVEAINSFCQRPLSPDELKLSFEALWPKLEAQLAGIEGPDGTRQKKRSTDEKLDEILLHLRHLREERLRQERSSLLLQAVDAEDPQVDWHLLRLEPPRQMDLQQLLRRRRRSFQQEKEARSAQASDKSRDEKGNADKDGDSSGD